MASGAASIVKRMWRGARGRGHALVSDSRASLLVESIIATTIFVMISGTALIGVSAAQAVRGTIQRQSVAETLVRNQMEYISSLAYQTWPYTYSTSTSPSGLITSTPAGYSVSAVSTSTPQFASDADFAKIVVTVSFGGEELISVETLRSNK